MAKAKEKQKAEEERKIPSEEVKYQENLLRFKAGLSAMSEYLKENEDDNRGAFLP